MPRTTRTLAFENAGLTLPEPAPIIANRFAVPRASKQ
jgi:hypothetical protein